MQLCVLRFIKNTSKGYGPVVDKVRAFTLSGEITSLKIEYGTVIMHACDKYSSLEHCKQEDMFDDFRKRMSPLHSRHPGYRHSEYQFILNWNPEKKHVELVMQYVRSLVLIM